MATPFSDIYDEFYGLIERDESFFNYFNLSNKEVSKIIDSRCLQYLKAATSRIMYTLDGGTDFFDYDEDEEQFNFDLNPIEVQLIANLMFESYLKQDIAKLKAFEVNFTPTDLQVFSPSNSRKTFMEMYRTVREENITMLDNYAAHDRDTFALKEVNYLSLTNYSDADDNATV